MWLDGPMLGCRVSEVWLSGDDTATPVPGELTSWRDPGGYGDSWRICAPADCCRVIAFRSAAAASSVKN